MQAAYILQPLEDIHLKSHLNHELSVNNSNKLIILFSIIAIFILAIACVNSMNLSSAYASKRMKEIGIRKAVGGRRSQIFWQFTGETFMISTLSLVFALGFVYLLLPGFSRFVERSIELRTVWETPFILTLLIVWLGSSLLAGLYPAAVLSTSNPTISLKGNADKHSKGSSFRNLLVMLQFSITIALMISALVMFLQIRYIQEKPIGYDREQVVVMRMTDPGLKKNFSVFKNNLLLNPQVIAATTSDNLPTLIENGFKPKFITKDGDEIYIHANLLWIDYNFFDFYRMDLAAGRNFSLKYGTDQTNAVIVNETFV